MRIGILTSGGDAPGMNAAIRAVTRCAIAKGMEVYGIRRGYEGLLDGDIKEMSNRSVGDILHRGGTMLETARCPRFIELEGQLKGKEMAETFKLDALVVIGGDGSMRGGLDLTKLGMKVMCIPGTIDNDLAYTDFTVGFDTAVNTVLGAISNVRDTSSSHERTTIIEVMGRHCGDIALYAGLAGGAESILVPEAPYNVNDICRKIIEGRNNGKRHSIILRAEGVEISTDELTAIIAEKTGYETKSMVISYLQRGGSPTSNDRILATRCASTAVELIAAGSESRAIGIKGGEIIDLPIDEALSQKRVFIEEYLELANILAM